MGHSNQDKRNRIIPMNQVVRELLSQQLRKSEYVFTSPRTGGCLVEIKKGFKKACELAGIHDLHFHDLRHTAASKLAATGADIVTIAEILGHSSFRMTKRYTHASEERKRNALEARCRKTWSQFGHKQQNGRVCALP